MMDYLRAKRARSRSKSPARTAEAEAPVLTEEDEEFLHRITTEGTPPELPERPAPPLPQRPEVQDLPETGQVHSNNAQIAFFNGARDIPLPHTPDVSRTATESEDTGKGKGKEKIHNDWKKSKWSFLRRDSRDQKRKATATGLMSAAEGLKSPDAQPNEDGTVSDAEATKEEEEMTSVLDQLNLAAVDNRVFSLSKESQTLLHKFTLVLKDLVNGVPTAYGDLESLLTNSEDQIQRSYTHLPDWLQKLIEQLPSKMTKSIGPEMLAAAAEKHGVNSKYANYAAKGAEKAGLKLKVPSLKDLISKPGAVAALLKTIMNFLKLRFPAFLGLNVLYSLALFVLLFVCWYCHKRGKEVRLEKERLLTEAEIAALDEDDDVPIGSSSAPPTTTALPGAPIRDVESGMYEPQEVESPGGTVEPKKYAEDGSLAQYERETRHGKKAGIEVTERAVHDDGQSSRELVSRDKHDRKRKEKEDRWKSAPSKAPLDSQESCILC